MHVHLIIPGTGPAGYSGDGSAATSAMITAPVGLVFDISGNLFIADNGDNRVRKVSTTGVITTVAGTKPIKEKVMLILT